MKFEEIKDLTDEELDNKLEDTKESFMKLRFQHATAQLDDTSRMRVVRKDIARIETLKNQRIKEAQTAKTE